MSSRPTDVWPRRLALILLSFALCFHTKIALSSEHATRRVLQNGQSTSGGSIRSMGWVMDNFPRRSKSQVPSCDPVAYHSPLSLNIARPSRSSFCFNITYKAPKTITYTCQQPANASQISRIHVLVAPKCGDAVSSVTVDGKLWSNVNYDNVTNLLSIDRVTTLSPADSTRPADRTVCIELQPNSSSCASVTTFCAPAYGPDPACAVQISDSRSTCCPVNRVSYEDAVVEKSELFQLFAKLNDGCETITSVPDLCAAIGERYRKELGLPVGSVQYLSYNCRASRMTVVLSFKGLKMDMPDRIRERSDVMLKQLTSPLGMKGVRAIYYSFPPPRQPPSVAPRQPLRPRPSQRIPPPSPLGPAPSPPAPSSSLSPPQSPPHYASQPPPVYGAYGNGVYGNGVYGNGAYGTETVS